MKSTTWSTALSIRTKAHRHRPWWPIRTTRTTKRKRKEEDGDASGGAAGYSTEQLAQLKIAALDKFAFISAQFDKMRKASGGYGSKAYVAAQEAISAELLGIRFTAKVVEKLCDTLRGQMEEVRDRARRAGPVREPLRHAARPLHQGLPAAKRIWTGSMAKSTPATRTAPCWAVTCQP
jgi:hypothetical protein